MFALTLNDVRARQAAIEIGRTGQVITVPAVMDKIRPDVSLTEEQLESQVKAELACMEGSGELFEQGRLCYGLHPALTEDSSPLRAVS